MLDVLAGVGRNARTGGYRRDAWSASELELRQWFRQEAGARGLDLHEDRNGNLWAWWGDPDAMPGVVTGSHLDSVREGGAFDGPLGVVSAFLAVDALRARGFTPARPLGIVSFSDEEGARFGVPCVGSRLLTGILPPERARGLTGEDGLTLAEVMRAHGREPDHLGPDARTLARVGVFVELHVEQGRALTEPVGVAAAIWPHGRWRFDFRGTADHAGTTALADRDDPMLAYARAVLAARQAAEQFGVVATFGKVRVSPNNANAIPSLVSAWLDARGSDEDSVRRLVASLSEGHDVVCESWTPEVSFPTLLRDHLASIVGDPARILSTCGGHDPATAPPIATGHDPARNLSTRGGHDPARNPSTRGDHDPARNPSTGSHDPAAASPVETGHDPARNRSAPILPTGAGHDAGILASAGVPSAMLFVRNPTGVSHSPAEFAEPADCAAGVTALAAVLADLCGERS